MGSSEDYVKTMWLKGSAQESNFSLLALDEPVGICVITFA